MAGMLVTLIGKRFRMGIKKLPLVTDYSVPANQRLLRRVAAALPAAAEPAL